MDSAEKLKAIRALSADDWKTVSDRAEELMHKHKFGCSETLMLAFQETVGREILPAEAVAMAGTFRGGLGGSGCLCGALAAGEMVLGAFFGYSGDASGQQDSEEIKKSRDLARSLHDEFRRRHGAACCRRLTKGLEPGSAERKKNCATLTGSAASITAGILAAQSAGAEPAGQK